jgi:hypothetical protein
MPIFILPEYAELSTLRAKPVLAPIMSALYGFLLFNFSQSPALDTGKHKIKMREIRVISCKLDMLSTDDVLKIR